MDYAAARRRTPRKHTSRKQIFFAAVWAHWAKSAELKRELAMKSHCLLDSKKYARHALLAERV